jgi:glutamate dehydrogenase (NAD(P)+)
MVREACRERRLDLARATVVVQGSGNVGGTVAQLLHETGVRVIGLSDIDTGLINTRGLDVPAVLKHQERKRTLRGCKMGDRVTNDELLQAECDILIPSATENQITSANAGKLRTKIIVEGANGPTTAAADDILDAAGTFVVPDILANAGGVVVSYFEWVKNLTHIPFGLMERRHHEASHKILARSLETMTGASFPLETASSFLKGAREIDLVRSGLDDIMRSAYGQISAIWNVKSEIPDLRTAAYSIAISRCVDAYSAIGI